VTNNSQTIQKLVDDPKLPIILVAVDIRSAYNVGAMFRTADGTGQTGIIVCGYTPPPDHPKVAKTALGADYEVPWAQVNDVMDVLNTKSVVHIGLELSSKSVDLFTWKIPSKQKVFLYVGNEVTGLSAEVLMRLDALVQLPMLGTKQSLNVAEAASIALYELYRKQNNL